RRGQLVVRRAGLVALPENLVRPDFQENNITDPKELSGALLELAASIGLAGQKKWSVALPEAATRTVILTLESVPASRGELEETLNWKIERAFGCPVEELQVARRRLTVAVNGRARYLVAGVQRAVLAEYEAAFANLGWRVGLVLPRHMGEAWWLMRAPSSTQTDSLLVSSHSEGFTALLLRRGEPLVVRSVVCEMQDCRDELYRLLLFYRDRMAEGENVTGTGEQHAIERLLVIGDRLGEERANELLAETLSVKAHALRAEDFRLILPSGDDINFDQIAAPAGLAALAWG
ncbi:MAG: hypothetical protein H0V88_11655, partial [Pyrinomonadaceae bacterium]|nr:hypothetical protein [Pyrinomonadaceae bacterium]